MLSSLTSRWFIYWVVSIANIVGYLLFLRGYFPSKVVLPGSNTFTSGSVSPFLDLNGQPKFERFILMVVDAMRSDFCYGENSGFDFLQQLIKQGNAIPFTAFSNPPTVTLPRLKGITTGGTPNFLDAILNIADDYDDSQGLHNQDSWIHQLKLKNKTINFFGDDTWLKLFPTEFQEYEGTNSFFVSDFTEVDNNVTRHLDTQLFKEQHVANNKNWDGLILHYLGLDHIGHKGGPNSVYMKPKQKEMDLIVKRLYNYINDNQETVLIVMGDHGMNEVGNHGGSSPGETSAALTFISPKFNVYNDNTRTGEQKKYDEYDFYNSISQIDLVPAIAGLLNFPIPKNSLGVMPFPLLQQWPEGKRYDIIFENCRQIMDLYSAKYGEQDPIWHEWLELSQSKNHKIEKIYTFLHKVQVDLASSATNYNYKDIYIGAAIMSIATIVTVLLFNLYFFRIASISPLTVATFQVLTVFYAIHFHGSSLVEEEHHLWNAATTVGIICMGLTYFDLFNSKRKVALLVVLLFCLRLIKSWNTTGQKWLNEPTIGEYLSKSATGLLWTLILLTYIICSTLTYIQVIGSHFRISKPSDLVTCCDYSAFFVAIGVSIGGSLSLSFKIVQYCIDGGILPVFLKFLLKWILAKFKIDLTNDFNLEDPSTKFILSDVSIQLSRWCLFSLFGVLITHLALSKFMKKSAMGKRGTVTFIANIITIYLIHQTSYKNIPIFLLLTISKFALAKLIQQKTLNIDQHIMIVSSVCLGLQQLTFFFMGNTNSLATVDLSNAYNGVKSYDVILVGILTFISNFAGPIFWSFSAIQLLFEPSLVSFEENTNYDLVNYPKLKSSIFLIRGLILLFFYTVSGLSLVASCINLRFHLFVWTVFSPKLLYFGSWLLLFNTGVDLIISMITVYL
ncbi:major facilitator super transporter protein [Lodderomyces elongisporus]|uniref:major facilitator super transporter protein n=1 Tax=Lodderomyces elongisporus TaxID=36914 RepID=UPI00291E8C71|nr:major facilitator super transporter protein [Lodderomyces elongisporus]WLF78026.1 major facilitator super transporter protein [Lodderomyces elongisporus]